MKQEPNITFETSEAADVFHHLNTYKKYGISRVCFSGFCWIAATIMAMTTAFVLALGWWGEPLKTFSIAMWSFSVFLVTVVAFIIPFRAACKLENVVQHIGKTYPMHQSALLSALQFLRLAGTHKFSNYLISSHLNEVNTIFKRLSPYKVFHIKTVTIPFILLIVVFFSASAAINYGESVFQVGLDTLLRDSQLLPTKEVKQTTKPVVSDLSIRLKYPEYLNKKEKVFASFSGKVSAPLGTIVFIEATPIDKNINKGAVVLSNGTTSALTLGGNQRLSGYFILDDVTWFSFKVGDAYKTISGPRRIIQIEKDSHPSIRMLQKTQFKVDADGVIPLHFEARDDVGVEKIDLIIRKEKGGDIQKTIVHCAPHSTHVKTEYQWPVQSISFGDVHSIELFIRAYDNDTVSGPKFSQSEAVTVKILTPKTRFRELLIKQNQLLDSLVDVLGARLSMPLPGSIKKADETRERFLKLQGQTEDVLLNLGRLVGELKKENVSSGYIDLYKQMRDEISSQLLYEAKLNEFPLASYKKRAGVNAMSVRLLEKTIIQIDGIILDAQFTEMNANSSMLATQHGKLSDLLVQYKKNASNRNRRKIFDTLAKMRDAAKYISTKLEHVRGKISINNLASSVEQTVDLHDQFREIEKAISEGDMERAEMLVENLEDVIGQLVASLESGHSQFKNASYGTQDEFLTKVFDKVAAIESSQLQIRRKTIGLLRTYREKVMVSMKDDIDSLVVSQSKRVNQIRKKIEKMRSGVSVDTSKLIEELRVLTKRMEDVLKQGDLDRTIEIATEIKNRIVYSRHSSSDDATYKELVAIEKISRNIIKKINNAFPAPNKVLNESNKRTLKTYVFNQRRVFGVTKRAQSWVKKQKSDMMFLSSQVVRHLQDVSSSMDKAVAELEKRRLSQAAKQQTIALERLLKLKQNLKHVGGSFLVETTTLNAPATDKVVIPSPIEYEVPKQFREEILKAMRGEMPSRYKEAIEKYYETLVR